jgi:outer membrane protein assembly factor BamB
MTWPTDRGGARRLGSTRERVRDLDDFAVTWERDRGGAVTDLVVGGGRVYAACSGGTVHALDAAGGDREWSLVHDGGRPSLCLGEDRLFLLTGTLRALDPVDGTVEWTRSVGGSGASHSAQPWDGVRRPVVADGSLLLTTENAVHALDPATGDQRWRTRFENTPGGPAAADGLVVVGTSWAGDPAPEPVTRGTVHALDAATGDPRWRTDIDGGPMGSPVIGDGRIHVGHVGTPSGNPGGYGLTTLDAATGDHDWGTGRTPNAHVWGVPTVTPDGGRVLATGWGGDLTALDATDGAVAWTHDPGDDADSWSTRTVVAAGVVYRVTDERKLTALALDTGDVLAETDSYREDAPTGGPAVGDGALFLGDGGGRVIAYGRSGSTQVYGEAAPPACPSCGADLDDRDASFCPSCGTELR